MVCWVLHKFAAFYEKTSEALRHKASEVFRSSSQIVVRTPCGSRDSVHLRDLIDELFHILDVGVWRVLRIDFGRIQNNDLHPIRPQRLQRSRKAAGLVGRLAEVGKTALLIKDFCNDVYLFIAHCHTPPSLLEVPLGLDHTGSILLIKLFPDFRAFVLVDILVAPEVEVIIIATP